MPHIFLDTNIFCADWLFKKAYSKAFINYLRRTQSRVLISPVVWSEMRAKYRDGLRAGIESINSALSNINDKQNGNINKMLTGDNFIEKLRPITIVDIDAEVENYCNFIKKELNLLDSDFLPFPNKPELLPSLVDKALNRIRPFSKNGEGFRDALIWESILEESLKNGAAKFILVSNDGSDKSNSGFGTGEAGNKKLHPDLQSEWNNTDNHSTIIYYESLESLIFDHISSSPFITKEYIQDKLNQNEGLDFISLLAEAIKSALRDNYRSIKLIYNPEFPRPNYVFYNFKDLVINEYSLIEFDDYDYGNGKVEIRLVISGICEVNISGNFDYNYAFVSETKKGKFNATVHIKKRGENFYYNYFYISAVSIIDFERNRFYNN